ncbi:MAG TPA: formyltransferase family protein [Elusimicrobiales bacterium]|nr:formyltransferase family protein [Elusimicrobiales bacterium]
MRIAFIGSVESSRTALVRLISLKAQVAGVLAPAASAFNSDFCDLAPVARSAGIPFRTVTDINAPSNVKWLRKLGPDIIFCVGFSQLIKRDILSLAPMGVIGFHPALLPENRGRNPIAWALALGLKYTGSTFFFMDEGADSGDILSQRKVRIMYGDTARTLYDRVMKTAVSQIGEFLPLLERGRFPRRKQKNAAANYWRKRGHDDGAIDFRMGSGDIYNLVRALAKPYVGAHVRYRGGEVKVWKAEEVSCRRANIECGKVLESGRAGVVVKCSGGAIALINHEFKALPKAGDYIL